jgi:head-tail adaptor
MTTAIGQFRHVVSLVVPGASTPDPDGGWGGEAWVPLDPPTWHCSIQAASLRDLQRLSGGVLSTTATHVLRGRYHPQLTRNARIQFGNRVFDVESVHDQDERRIEVEVIAHEQLGAQPVAPPYADQVVADGAGHYWRLGDLGGTIAVDAIGFAHGTISGGVTLKQPGALMDSNPAMAFNGTTGRIDLVTGSPTSLPYTWELWLKTGFSGGERAALSNFSPPYPTDVDAMLVNVTPTSGVYLFVVPGGGGAAGGTQATGYSVTDNVWHHIVIAMTSIADIRIYQDGVLRVSGPASAGALTRPAPLPSIGGRVDGASFFSGSLDEVAIYPLALTATQVAAHYAAATGS